MLDIKHQLGLSCPRIGLLGYSNMFCDTSPFDALFDIDLRSYMVGHREELAAAVEQAKSDGCLAVVGGDIVCACAQAIGLHNRFIPSGIESLRTALETAARVCYAIGLEKRNSAEMNTMLNYTFTGIMRVDRDGRVQRVNRVGYDMLGRPPSEVLGQLLPLRRRREDIWGWVSFYLKQWQEKYKRYVRLTQGAQDFMLD